MSADKEAAAPITFTSPTTTTTVHPDPNNSTPSNPSSFQSDHLVSLYDTHFGFTPPQFRHTSVVGTVPFYQRHVFLCYKNPLNWPPRIDAAEFDRLPRLLSASLAARKLHFNLLTCLAICEGRDGTETSNGDVLIFPDMIRYRRLTHFDVDTFVEEVLIKDAEWLPGNPEKLKGFYVFVCCHGSRDRRCGVCGPPLVTRFREEVELHGLEGSVSISPCSHVGGHKYAGNVIIFGPSCINGQVTGHWYGYVRPDDVPILLERHVKKGEIVEGLWRGQMGMSEEEQRKAQELRLVNNGGATLVTATDIESDELPPPMMNASGCGSHLIKANGCCQTNGSKSQQHSVSNEKDFNDCDNEAKVTAAGNKYKKQLFGNNGIEKRKICALPWWFENWEREDTYAALAVVCAVVSVGIAYSCCKQL